MTRNIIAEFSGSLDSNGNFKKYEAVSGTAFSDVYNEELDSATLVLAHVKEEDRLIGKIKPYDFVRVHDENGTLNHVYLVDSYNEREERITDGRLFSYTISLMSQTKLLEKIQCPSLTITHQVKDGKVEKKTIFDKICEYMDLYIPRIKMRTSTTAWDYRPLIEIPGSLLDGSHFETYTETGYTTSGIIDIQEREVIFPILVGKTLTKTPETTVNLSGVSIEDIVFNSSTGSVKFSIYSTRKITAQTLIVNFAFYDGSKKWSYKAGYKDFFDKFNVPTADLGSSYFTLRQLLTMLMQQVGCIPTVENLKLSYLDFNKIEEEFNVDETINHVNIGLSSDSYANTLVNTASNVLDSGNEVVSEVLGFRDSNSVLLKQQSNLYLETKFPIYKVNELKLNCMLVGALGTRIEKRTDYSSVYWVKGSMSAAKTSSNSVNISVVTTFSGNPDYINSRGSGTIYFYNFSESTGKYTKLGSQQFSCSSATNTAGTTVTFNQNFTHYIISGTINCSVQWTAGLSYATGSGLIANISSNARLSVDITPLVKESQERSTLKTNFKEMSVPDTIEDLSKYIYGTVGYTIGSNRISGFSDTYSQIQTKVFPYSETKTYIENIYNWLSDKMLKKELAEVIKKEFDIPEISEQSVTVSLFKPTGFINFSQFTFNIKYQPLNSFNLAYIKNDEELDFPIEQLNSSESGLTDFDRLSTNQQETVDRIGNQTLSISQRITPEQFGTKLHKIPSVYSRDGIEHVIFKRTYTVGNYKYDVSYVGSKNAILKNYFTSIRTKYRAYEYVDYSQSVLRKERDTIFVRIDTDYYNGDDKIKFISGDNTLSFIFGARTDKTSKPLMYMCERSYNKDNVEETIKNDISLISNNDSFAIIYEQPDNISAGPYIANSMYSTFYEGTDSQAQATGESELLGGVPQKWQEWNLEKYGLEHYVIYTSNLNFFSQNKDVFLFQDTTSTINQVTAAAKAPILTNETKQMKSDANVFYIASKGQYQRKFYKDASERLNHTVQFVYYCPSGNVAWTDEFISANGFIGNSNYRINALYGSTNMDLDSNIHKSNPPMAWNSSISTFLTVIPEQSGVPAHVHIDWTNIRWPIIKLGYNDGSSDYNAVDFIAFKRPTNPDGTLQLYTDYYVTLNDTKSDYVMDVKDGVLYRAYKVKTNTLNREVENL